MKKVVGNLEGTPIVECSSLNELEDNEIGYVKGIPSPSTKDIKYYGCVSLYKRENGIVRSITHGCAAFKYHADKVDEYIKKTYGEGCYYDWSLYGGGLTLLQLGDFESYIDNGKRRWNSIYDSSLISNSIDSFMILASHKYIGGKYVELFHYFISNFPIDVLDSNGDTVGTINLIDFCTPLTPEEFWNPDRK